MSFQHGRKARIAAAGLHVSGLFKEASFEASGDTAETSTFGTIWKQYISGMVGASVGLSGFYDPLQSATVQALVLLEPGFVATVGPAGLSVGDLARLLVVDATNYTESASIGDAVMMELELQSRSEVGLGNALVSPDVPISGTNNETTVDLVAQVTGATWFAHFHVHTLNATNVVLRIQDSATGSTWADLAGATSGTLTAAGGVRISGVGLVRRYVRAAWVHTGGATNSVATVAFSRRP